MSIRNRSRSNEFTLIPTIFLRSQEVSANAKLVWMSVASRRQANAPDPGREVLCAETELDPTVVREAEDELNSLTDKEWLALGLPL